MNDVGMVLQILAVFLGISGFGGLLFMKSHEMSGENVVGCLGLCAVALGLWALGGAMSGSGGEGGAKANNEDRESIPQYSAQKTDEGYLRGNQPVVTFEVTTDTDSEEDLRAIVKDLRRKNPKKKGVLVFFKPTKDGELYGAGFAFEDIYIEEALLEATKLDPAAWKAGREESNTWQRGTTIVCCNKH